MKDKACQQSHLIIGYVSDSEVFWTSEHKWSGLFFRRDIKEEGICVLDGMKHAHVGHEYDNYGLDGRIQLTSSVTSIANSRPRRFVIAKQIVEIATSVTWM